MEQPYRNLSGASGVVAFRIAASSITVRFNTGAAYLYTYHSTGAANVEQMKQLALRGRGLSTFIAQHVRDKYERML